MVRKLGVPGQPELAMGAIASGGIQVDNDALVRRLGISEAAIDKVAGKELTELVRRERRYRGDRAAVPVAGRTVVLVDDGLATGTTMRVVGPEPALEGVYMHTRSAATSRSRPATWAHHTRYGRNFPFSVSTARSPLGSATLSTSSSKSMALTIPSPNSSPTSSRIVAP